MLNKIINKLENIIPKRMFGIYLLVGVWNTIFGTLAYWGCVWLCDSFGHFGYMYGAICSTAIGVTHSFLTYKFFVFKTKGNYIKEYFKCWGVYGSATLINLCLLPFCVEIIRFIVPFAYKIYAPYIGGVVLSGVTIVISFLGHKNITFKSRLSN